MNKELYKDFISKPDNFNALVEYLVNKLVVRAEELSKKYGG